MLLLQLRRATGALVAHLPGTPSGRSALGCGTRCTGTPGWPAP